MWDNWLLARLVSSAISEIISVKTTSEPPTFEKKKTEQKATSKTQMYKYPMLFALNVNHCFKCVMEMWDCSAHWCQNTQLTEWLFPCHTVVTQRLMAWDLRPGSPGLWARQNTAAQTEETRLKLSSSPRPGFLALVCLSAVYSDTESDATQFLWIPSVSGSQALFSLLTEPRSSAGDYVSPQAPGRVQRHQKNVQCPAGMQKTSHLWDPMSGSPEAAGVCPLVAPLILISQKKPVLATGGAVHFSQISSR